MATSTIVLFITVLVSICHQIAGQYGDEPFPITGRYRDPDVLYYFRRLCERTDCRFEQVCESRVFQCLIPPCPPEPFCVQTPGGSMKQGNCPHQSSIIAPRRGRRIECNTDYGCNGNNICCHGEGTSRCMRPRRSEPRRSEYRPRRTY